MPRLITPFPASRSGRKRAFCSGLAYSAKGLAFRAVREDEIAAAAMGVNVTYHKVTAFVIGAFFAGVAGGLIACYDGNLAPESFRFTRSMLKSIVVYEQNAFDRFPALALR